MLPKNSPSAAAFHAGNIRSVTRRAVAERPKSLECSFEVTRRVAPKRTQNSRTQSQDIFIHVNHTPHRGVSSENEARFGCRSLGPVRNGALGRHEIPREGTDPPERRRRQGGLAGGRRVALNSTTDAMVGQPNATAWASPLPPRGDAGRAPCSLFLHPPSPDTRRRCRRLGSAISPSSSFAVLHRFSVCRRWSTIGTPTNESRSCSFSSWSESARYSRIASTSSCLHSVLFVLNHRMSGCATCEGQAPTKRGRRQEAQRSREREKEVTRRTARGR